jgi:hypothetical protein
MASLRLKVEEYSPIAGFLKDSFAVDRPALSVRFAKFTPQFEADFNAQRLVVKDLDSTLVLTEEQKGVTNLLYNKADEVNAELNFLSYYFREAGLDTKIITKTKSNLVSRNIEGACLKIKDIIQYIAANQSNLESKGMATNYPADLATDRLFLESKNEVQNTVKNAVKDLYNANRTAYDDLYSYISTICDAGKIMYKGQIKADQYTISKLQQRMKSGNSGSKTTPPVV